MSRNTTQLPIKISLPDKNDASKSYTITLRAFKVEDAHPLALIANEPLVSKYLNPLFPKPYRVADAYAFLHKQYDRYCAIMQQLQTRPHEGAEINQNQPSAAPHPEDSSSSASTTYEDGKSNTTIVSSDTANKEAEEAALVKSFNWLQFTNAPFLESLAIDFQGKLAGTISNFPVSTIESSNELDDAIELGYFLGLPFHNRGVMSAVLPVFIGQVRTRFGIKRVIKLRIHRDNLISAAVALKLGFKVVDPISFTTSTSSANASITDDSDSKPSHVITETKSDDAVRIYLLRS